MTPCLPSQDSQGKTSVMIVGCCVAIACLVPVAMYQTGAIHQLPDPPSAIFDSNVITGSKEAHPFGIPDALLGLASFGTTVALVLASRRSVAARRLLAAKLVVDATVAAFNATRQVVSFGKLCSWCTVTPWPPALPHMAVDRPFRRHSKRLRFSSEARHAVDNGIEKHEETRPKTPKRAKGKPGAKPRWTSGAKTLVGTAASSRSRIWYTIGNGILNEIYFPDVDQANTRSVRFLVADASGFFSDEEWDATHNVQWLETGIPSCKIETRCKLGKYTIEKEIVTDPVRDTLMMRVHFRPSVPELRLYLFVDVHMGDRGADNSAWAGTYKGEKLLIASRDRTCLAAMSNPPLLQSSCGYIGKSDGFTLLSHHQPLSESNTAMEGNVAMTGEIDYSASEGQFLISLACGSDPAEAAQQARAGVLQDFDTTRELFAQHWKADQGKYDDIADLSGESLDMYRVSTAVLETHQSKRFPGGFVASLSLPWGFARSDDDVGGYHVLWPRDMVETAMGKLASGDARSARSTLFYLNCTEDEHCGWSQDMWLDGTPHWGAIQMDGMALPIFSQTSCGATRRSMAMMQLPWSATPASFSSNMGRSRSRIAGRRCRAIHPTPWQPRSQHSWRLQTLKSSQVRWPKQSSCDRLRMAWNDSIDEFTYVEGTTLAKKYEIDGYYVRMMPPERVQTENGDGFNLKMPNLPSDSKIHHAVDIVSPDAIALVRFGLRTASDPRITSTVKLLDATLKRATKTGAVWIRSTNDGYGEKVDGSPFDKNGVGRG
jgi:glucoamylase